MSEHDPKCQHCGQPVEVSREELARLVTSNREAAMQALRINDPSSIRPRFRLEPFVQNGEDGRERYGLRRPRLQ